MLLKRKILLVISVIPLLVTSCSESDGVRVTGGENQVQEAGITHTSHTGPADGIWPPQPEAMTNAESFPASARAGVLSGLINAARSSVLNNPQIRTSLGDNYREIDASLGDAKGDVVATIVFYNYTTDETIIATLGRDGAINSAVSAASVYQPMEHPEEQFDAIALARTALTDSSFDVTGLIPTAMLAYPSRSNIISTEQQFYNERVLYVTFGPGSGEMPVYTALVDISNDAVVEHGLVK